MASLTGQLVAETYKALLKTIDNDILTASEKQITDGFGGGSNVFIDSQGFLRANKYKVTNGLATQFLKADGSLDSNTYLTGITSSQIITALGYTPVPTTRTLTINGTTYDLSANRSWTIAGTAAVWGNISGTLSNQTDLQNALNAKYNNPTGTISQYIRGDGTIANFPTIAGGLPTGGTAGQILAKIDATDYNAHWIDNYATQTKNEVKLGQTLTKGTPVYVSSANGTNMIVSAASNTSEALSSKTFGLLETGGATNAFVKCVTFGLLAGLDTSTAQAGDPVWLGVNGALIFGLANKPYAPAHLVYIGVVTRVQQNNGEIFVNVQNGFELKEIHDVYIADPANNHGLFYDLATGLWKNKSIVSALGYTPQAQLSGTGFVKASGTTISYDNSTYLTTTDAASTYQRLDKMVSNLLASATEYPNSNAVINALALKADALNPVFTGYMTISGAEPKLYFTDTDQNPDYFIGADAGFFRIYDQTAGATRFVINSSGVTTIAGDLIVGTIAKSGGTATQFLKADGSIDSSTYVTSASLANYLLISTAASTYQRLDKMVSNLLASDTEYPNSNAVLAKLALKADAANPVFTGDMTISGIAPKLYFTDTDNNPDYTLFVDSGYFYIYDQTAGATRFSINPSGNISTGIGKTITTSGLIVDKVSGVSTITFPAGTNDPGFIQHIEITPNTGIMRFSVGDDNDSNDYFAFGNNNVPDAFRINAMGTVSIGVWQATAIADAYIASASTWNAKQNAITLTTTGSSGAATFTSNTLNIPNYGSALSGYLPLTGGTLTGTLNGTIVNTSSYSRFYNVGVGGAASGTYATYSDAVIGFPNLHLVATTGAVYVNSALALPFYINPVGGNVMIGTTTDAGYKLDINGTGRFSGNLQIDGSSYPFISIVGGNVAYGGGLKFFGSTTQYAEMYGEYQSSDNGQMFFRTRRSGSITNAMRISNTGELYVNTISSAYSSSGRGLLALNGSTNSLYAWSVNDVGKGYLYHNGTNVYIENSNSGGDFNMYQVGAGSITLNTNGALAMRVKSNGDIEARKSIFFGLDYSATQYVAISENQIYRSGGGILYINNSGSGNVAMVQGGGKLLVNTATDAGFLLDVNGSARIVGNVNYSSSSALYPRTTSVTDWYLCKHNASGDRIENALGTNNPFTLGNHIGSTYTANIFLYGGGWATFNSSVTATAFFESSDGRLKTLIDESAQISGIENLQAKLYEKNGKIELGYFAQDAEKLMPYAVTKNADGFLNLSYREIHTAKISRLEQRVAELEKQLNLN